MSAMTPLPVQDAVDEVHYPSSDGEPMAETGIHVVLMLTLLEMLREHYFTREDVYVIANIFLYYERGNAAARRSPDVMVIKGVRPEPERDSFKVWEEGAVPSVVIELTSSSTADEDMGPKKELYERIGVREYFLFDPLGDYLPRPLVAYRLVAEAANGNGEDPSLVEVHHRYEELPPDAEGGIPSIEMGLRLVPQGSDLQLIDQRTGKPLLKPGENFEQLKARDRQLRDRDKQLTERDRQLTERDRQIEQLQQQLADLRARLGGTPPPPGS